MERKLSILVIFLMSLPMVSFAQVGIGNTNPDTNTVLDLHNTGGKGLLLPQASTFSQMSNRTGMLYALDSNLFLKRSDFYVALTGWKFRYQGNTSNDVYYNNLGSIGIGLTNYSSIPAAKLHIQTTQNIDLVSNGSLLIGKSNATNIAFNDVEIQSREIASSAKLIINEDGGHVRVGSQEIKSDVKVNGNLKELHHPTNQYYDLVPAGMIIMWYGDTNNIPEGWALCNGKIYNKVVGYGSLQSPDLRGKFVASSGNNGAVNYTPYMQGGQDSVTLTKAELPAHNHSVYDPGHSHSYTYVETPTQSDAGYWDCGLLCPGPNTDEVHWTSQSSSTGNAIVVVYQDKKGEGKPHENRPKYYTLVYIMKL
jgi:microcystin-dependent protein